MRGFPAVCRHIGQQRQLWQQLVCGDISAPHSHYLYWGINRQLEQGRAKKTLAIGIPRRFVFVLSAIAVYIHKDGGA